MTDWPTDGRILHNFTCFEVKQWFGIDLTILLCGVPSHGSRARRKICPLSDHLWIWLYGYLIPSILHNDSSSIDVSDHRYRQYACMLIDSIRYMLCWVQMHGFRFDVQMILLLWTGSKRVQSRIHLLQSTSLHLESKRPDLIFRKFAQSWQHNRFEWTLLNAFNYIFELICRAIDWFLFRVQQFECLLQAFALGSFKLSFTQLWREGHLGWSYLGTPHYFIN